ncbi:MAG: hypothetical protein LBG99_05930 [Propionibacteriaceae bacterium]|jgi:hypothetical protein|nr:hypothetical protein [Propionibacteriaceae bacterium]
MTPIVNTHVHVPPNFSAFTTARQVVEAAQAEGVSILGLSNFFDQQVYSQMGQMITEAGILPLFGLEFITVVPDLEAQGIRINDPANPGRMYLTGKGIDPCRTPTTGAAQIAAEIRRGNDDRAEKMVARVAEHFFNTGFDTGLDAETIIAQVATRSEVPTTWVSLQERHIAQAFQEAVFGFTGEKRTHVLTQAYGCPPHEREDPVAVQAEIRSRLLKSGTPGFVPEAGLSFEDAYTYILDMGGIPCYPILADGSDPICPFEASPSKLVDQILDRGIYAAELIPIRNHSALVDEYVHVLRSAGLIVMAGTEHNTLDRIPIDPSCVDGPMSITARQGFFEGTCVVAAHADLISRNQPGYVDSSGARVGEVSTLAGHGKTMVQVLSYPGRT